MIIGVDIRDLRIARTGQRTTLEEICRQFRLLGDDTHRFYFFDASFPVYTGKNKFLLMVEHARQQLWKQVILPVKAWRKKCDVVYCNDYFAPIIHLNYTTVQLFHDAVFFEHREYCNRIWLLLFNNIAVPAARRSAFIITPSNDAKQRVQRATGIAEERIVPIYHGPKTITPDNGFIPEWLPTRNGYKYILHIGVMEKRKNLPALVHAFKLLKDAGYADYKLLLAGKGNGKIHSDDSSAVTDAIRQCGLENEVVLPGYLPDEWLGTVYKHASLYVFPSAYEGFGLPILEAFSFGLPVIVSDNTCLPEVGGDAVLTFNPHDVNDIVAKMRAVLDNENLRQELIRKGAQRLASFSWADTATNLLRVFEKAVKNKGR